jgi:multidrug resistance efflux pump
LAGAWILEKKPRVKALIETSAEPARDRTIRSARRYGLAAAIAALLLVVFFLLPISATVGGEAQVVPRDRKVAFSKVEGLIDRIFVKEGDQVREGQVLASLDPKELDYKIASAKAELDVLSEKAALYRSYLDEDPDKLAESRLVELRIKAARLDLQYYQWQRQLLEIKAPCTGIILTKDVQTLEGKKLTTGEAFCEIAIPGELWVDVYVPEGRVANVRSGNPLRLYLNNEPLRVHNLTAAEITPSAEADPRLGNVYRVKASFADGQESARVGMKGIGKIDTRDTTLWCITTQRFAGLWNQWSLWF